MRSEMLISMCGSLFAKCWCLFVMQIDMYIRSWPAGEHRNRAALCNRARIEKIGFFPKKKLRNEIRLPTCDCVIFGRITARNSGGRWACLPLQRILRESLAANQIVCNWLVVGGGGCEQNHSQRPFSRIMLIRSRSNEAAAAATSLHPRHRLSIYESKWC